MTSYEQGFLTKCAECGVSQDTTYQLLKQAMSDRERMAYWYLMQQEQQKEDMLGGGFAELFDPQGYVNMISDAATSAWDKTKSGWKRFKNWRNNTLPEVGNRLGPALYNTNQAWTKPFRREKPKPSANIDPFRRYAHLQYLAKRQQPSVPATPVPGTSLTKHP